MILTLIAVSVAFYYSYKRAALIMSDPRLYGDPQLVQDVFDSRQPWRRLKILDIFTEIELKADKSSPIMLIESAT